MTHLSSARAVRPLGLLAACLFLLLGATPAATAHSQLESSTPAAGARLSGPPQKIVLVFNQHVAAEFAKVSLKIGNGQAREIDVRVDRHRVVARLGSADGQKRATSTSAGPVPWRVAYRVVSADGHPITGNVEFFAPLEQPKADGTASQAPATPSAEEPSEPSTEASPAAGQDEDSPAGDGERSPWLSTLIIGALTTAAVVLIILLLLRGSRRDAAE